MGFTTVALGRKPTPSAGRVGCAGAGATAREYTPFRPVMNVGLIAAPLLASYSPTVLLPRFATKRLLPETARESGPFRPGIKLAVMGAPAVAAYWPTVLLLRCATKSGVP